MRSAELLTLGVDGKLLERLGSWCLDQGLRLRGCADAAACLKLLRQGSSGMLLVRLGRDVEQELGLVSEASIGFPRIPIVVMSDVDQPQLAGLAWDLGAFAVLFPPHGVVELIEVLAKWNQ